MKKARKIKKPLTVKDAKELFDRIRKDIHATFINYGNFSKLNPLQIVEFNAHLNNLKKVIDLFKESHPKDAAILQGLLTSRRRAYREHKIFASIFPEKEIWVFSELRYIRNRLNSERKIEQAKAIIRFVHLVQEVKGIENLNKIAENMKKETDSWVTKKMNELNQIKQGTVLSAAEIEEYRDFIGNHAEAINATIDLSIAKSSDLLNQSN